MGSEELLVNYDHMPPPVVADDSNHYRVYGTRWYVLTLYALLGIHTNIIYSTFSPIAPIAESALNLNQSDISILANWFNIMFCVGLIPFMWMLQVKGMRGPIVISASLIAIGAWIRCLSTYGMVTGCDKAMLHLGAALNGLSIPVLWCGCTKLSAVWFPPSERTISTSVALVAGGFGVAISFVIGPYTVDGLAKGFSNGSKPSDEEYAKAIHYLLYGEAVVAALLLLMTLIYFPSEPPTPPCFTAKSERYSFFKGFVKFSKSKDGWLLLVLYSISGQLIQSYAQFLSLELGDIMNDIETGWLGFGITTAGVVSGPLLGLTTKFWVDRWAKHVCCLLMVIGAGFAVLFFFAEEFVPSLHTKWLAWLCLVGISLFVAAAQPLWWEMACESIYPVPEEIVGTIYALGFTIIGIIFYGLYSFPQLGSSWVNYVLAIGEVICIPLILFYSGETRRLHEDQVHENDEITPQNEPEEP